jgi:hypothetical protein
MEKFIKINQLDGVAELQYKYTSLDQKVDLTKDKEDVRCCLAVPALSLMKVPINLHCSHDKKVRFGKSVDMTYTV